VFDDPGSQLRASDDDRERVAAQLRRHATDGRLTMDELDERLAQTYGARTHGDLARLLRDLPAVPPDAGLTPAGREPTPPVRRRRGIPPAVWASYFSVNLVVFAIWLVAGVTGDSWNPWFLWVAGPWGAVLAAREIQARAR
jgi:hypothetical protein